jgi:hypothetical protein
MSYAAAKHRALHHAVLELRKLDCRECVHATSIAVVAGAFAVPELTRSADIKVK